MNLYLTQEELKEFVRLAMPIDNTERILPEIVSD